MNEEKLKKIKPIREYEESIIDDILTRGDQPKISLSCFPRLNDCLWGFNDGEMVVVASRTSQGKTSFLSAIAYNLALSGVPVLYLSLESTVEEILERMICNTMGIKNNHMRKGNSHNPMITEKTLDFFSKFKGENKLKLMVTCGIGYEFSDIIYLLETMQETPKVIIIDYIGCIKMAERDARGSMDEYIRKFHELAFTKKFCGILCSQINRGAEHTASKEPYMHQLKETGKLEENAEKVILLHWPYFYSRDELEFNKYQVRIAKNKNGKTGPIEFKFEPEFYRFTEMPGYFTSNN